jgi:hypothetical protein
MPATATDPTTENRIVQHHIQSLTFAKEMMFPTAFNGLELAPEQTVYQPGQATSHILWNAGHLVWAMDHELIPSLGGQSILPESYHELFRIGSKPSADASRYPGIEEIIANFKKVSNNAILLLNSMTDEELSKPVWEGALIKEVFPTLGALLDAQGFHTGYHIGQISLLRRIQGTPSGFRM